MQLIFKVKKAKERGRSGIEIVLSHRAGSRAQSRDKISKAITDNTDELLQTLDKLLKRNKIELESLSDIKVEIEKGAGLTSTRIVSSIVKALSLDL
jgi:hypothetical protein